MAESGQNQNLNNEESINENPVLHPEKIYPGNVYPVSPENTKKKHGLNPVTKTEKLIIKLVTIAAILAALHIPLHMVKYQNKERAGRLRGVQSEIAASWGGEQTVSFNVVPQNLTIEADVTSEIRSRGIYQVPVYSAAIKMDMQFAEGVTEVKIYISDDIGLRSATAEVDGHPVECKSGTKYILIADNGREISSCRISLQLRGSGKLLFETNRCNSKIKIRGNCSDPGFIGTTLPDSRSVEEDGFSATWNLSNVANQHQIGVNFLVAASNYQRVERTMTYATFFLIVFFITIFVGEMLTSWQIHPLQYAVAAGGPVLFYLMLLALSEHINFAASYFISAAMIVLMVTAYAKMFMRRYVPALIMGGVFIASYVVNYIVLQLEDFALLAGTLVLAVILGALMLITGKVNQQESEKKDNA